MALGYVAALEEVMHALPQRAPPPGGARCAPGGPRLVERQQMARELRHRAAGRRDD
eukprot:gene2619-38622_t